MTRIGRRLVEDFLLPALNDERYGDRLQWVDKSKLYFSIRWNHKNAAKWTLEDTVVFQDWDKLKGHHHPDTKGYYMQAKQRFRAALYKLNTVRTVHSQNKHVKIYQLVLDNDKKKHPESPESRPVSPLKAVPTSVICRNNSYVPPKSIPAVERNIKLEEPKVEFFNDGSSHSNDVINNDHEEMEKKEIKRIPTQRHVLVQPTPVYPGRVYGDVMSSLHRSITHNSEIVFRHYQQPGFSGHIRYSPNLQTTSFEVREVSPSRSYIDCNEVLNLSLKSENHNNTKIPVSAR